MSTRSGKRIHNDDIILTEADVVLMSERKTRSKRAVDNGDDQVVVSKPKRRQNYVSYPSEESAGGNGEVETLGKTARALRNTLREQNAAAEEVEVTNVKKQARQTRRTKMLSETATEETPSPHHEEIIEVVITNGKPKYKKNKKKATKITEHAEVIDKENSSKGNKKKKNKRKKNSRTNSLVEENIMSKGNETHTSVDSFHSAAGGPANADGNSTSPKESGTLLIDDNAHQGKNKKKICLKNISCEGDDDDLNSTAKFAVDTDMVLKTTFDKETESTDEIESNKRKSSLKNATFEKDNTQDATEKLNTTFEKEPSIGSSNKRKRKSHVLDSTYENTTSKAPKKSDIPNKSTSNGILNTTFEKDDIINRSDSKKPRKSNIIEQIKGLFSKNTSPRKSLRISETAAPNGMLELSPKPDEIKQKPLDSTFDKESKLNSTFDKESKLDSTFDKESKLDSTFDKESKLDSTFDKIEEKPASNKSSLISSDLTGSSLNVTLDKSDEVSRISITDDDSKTENILNATPVLIESSIEDSKVTDSSMKENKTPESQPVATPLKREGTFTKDESEAVMTPKQTPGKRQTLPAAGCTPYHSNNKGPKKSVLNLTHSIEKQGRLSSVGLPRATRVMFCSPVNNPAVVIQQKTKVIKSSLKGSNKSFVHEEREPAPPSTRKRSLSQATTDVAAKRSRWAPPPRPRTASAMAKLSTSTTPAKPLTPAPKSEVKATKLPNFAALHARRFERMESLDECQERRARRAKILLQPTGSLDIIEKSSPRVTPAKPSTPAKPPKLPTLETLQRGYTRFGFKMECAVNPFTVPIKPVAKPKEIKPIPVAKKPQPSLTGATSLRKAVAKQTIMREKSFTGTGKRDESRKETRTIIKGVRTNRRFELQMMSRNINC